jgi:hypothetical protein
MLDKRPELLQDGQGAGHIFPMLNGYGIDFTATQFPNVNQVPLITPVSQIPSVYKRIGGYFTDAPEWMGSRTYWQGPWDDIPVDVMKDLDFADEYFKENFADVKGPDLRSMLADVREEMEGVDDASEKYRSDPARHKALQRDYRALIAVENVISNNAKAIKNNLLDTNIFMYDYDGDPSEIAAIHVELRGTVADVKWLGSYNALGGQLYKRAAQEAKRRGATSVEVEAKWNSDGFYRKMGLYQGETSKENPFTDSPLTKFTGKLEEDSGLLDDLNNGDYGQAVDDLAFIDIPRSEIAATRRAMREHKRGIIKHLLTFIKDPAHTNEDIKYYIDSAIIGLRGIGINWPELEVIENSVLTDTDLDENFSENDSSKSRDQAAKVLTQCFNINRLNMIGMMLHHFGIKLDKDPELHKIIDDNAPALIAWYDGMRTGAYRNGAGFASAMFEIARLVNKGYRAPWIVKYLNDHKKDSVLTLLQQIKKSDKNSKEFLKTVLPKLKKLKLGWPELDAIERSMRADRKISENFADGKGPRSSAVITSKSKIVSEDGTDDIETIIDRARHGFSRNYDVENMLNNILHAGFTINDHPELKKVINDNRPKIAKYIKDILGENDLEELNTRLRIMYRILKDVGLHLPDPIISKLLTKAIVPYKGELRELIDDGNLWFLLDMMENFIKWGIKINIVDFNDANTKTTIMKQILTSIKNDDNMYRVSQIIAHLRANGVDWPELAVIERSMRADKKISENFADGKGPGRKGDSARHGIPKGATIAQLEKAAKAPGRKGQLARWQLNMRRGKAKR